MTRWIQPEYQNAFPLAFIMRQRFPDLWLRIHSLPESKRYPDSEEERAIILKRYTSFGTALLGKGSPCFIIRARMNATEPDEAWRGSFSWTHLQRVEESDEDFWFSWRTDTVWQPEAFRDLLLDIADDRERQVLFLSKTTDCVFAPYDGGADGFSHNAALIRRLREEFSPWRSQRTDGL
jgi:hypothetical protein